MNSAKLNDWLGVVANIGIVAGLIIVYLELDHANRLAEANALQAFDAEVIQAQKDFAESDHLPEIVVKAEQNGFESLSAVEALRYREWERGRLQRLNAIYRQNKLGFIDRDVIDRSITIAIRAGWIDAWKELGMESYTDGAMWRELQDANEAAKKNP